MWESLGDLIPKSVKKAGIEKNITDAMICDEFAKIAHHILGDSARKCRAVYVKDRTLWVAVLSNTVSNELKMYEQDVLNALSDKFGKGHIEQLRFMV
jgi:hypothetical protein